MAEVIPGSANRENDILSQPGHGLNKKDSFSMAQSLIVVVPRVRHYICMVEQIYTYLNITASFIFSCGLDLRLKIIALAITSRKDARCLR